MRLLLAVDSKLAKSYSGNGNESHETYSAPLILQILMTNGSMSMPYNRSEITGVKQHAAGTECWVTDVLRSHVFTVSEGHLYPHLDTMVRCTEERCWIPTFAGAALACSECGPEVVTELQEHWFYIHAAVQGLIRIVA